MFSSSCHSTSPSLPHDERAAVNVQYTGTRRLCAAFKDKEEYNNLQQCVCGGRSLRVFASHLGLETSYCLLKSTHSFSISGSGNETKPGPSMLQALESTAIVQILFSIEQQSDKFNTQLHINTAAAHEHDHVSSETVNQMSGVSCLRGMLFGHTCEWERIRRALWMGHINGVRLTRTSVLQPVTVDSEDVFVNILRKGLVWLVSQM